MGDVNIRYKILNIAKKCIYCQQSFYVPGTETVSDDKLLPNTDKIIEAEHNGHKYEFHEKCWTAFQVARRLNGKM